MTRSIVICEKPSQAENIRSAIGTSHGDVLPAQGHLFTLADPETYNADWKLWQGFHLLLPDQFKKVPTIGETAERTQQQERKRKAIATALKGADRVIIATDCDREGQVIGTEIVEALGFRGEVMRAMFTSEDAGSLKEAFAALRPNNDYRRLYEAGLARERADQVYNLSLTRAATIALIPPGVKAILGIGRVRTPTLGIVCIREIAIQRFKPATSYGIAATVQAGGREVVLTHHPDKPPVTDRAQGEAAVAAAIGQSGALVVATNRKKKAGPKPPDLSTLQEVAGRWGWTASKVMEVAQALYDQHKITTYPRAETRFLPEALIPAAQDITAALGEFGPWKDAAPALATIRTGKQGVFSDAGLGGESHHAIIPNPKTLDTLPTVYDALSADERRLFDVIARLFLQSVSADYEYSETSMSLAIGEATYATKGTVPIVPGWRALRDTTGEGDRAKDEGDELPAIEDGSAATIRTAQLAEKTTRAPERFNEGTLIKAMKNAAQFITDPALKERLKDAKGIGTQATRDTVISGLKDQGLLMVKAGKLYPTQAGMAVFALLHKVAPALVDPGTTAVWESRIDEILSGGISVDTFVQEVAAQTRSLIEILRKAEPTTAFGTAAPTAPMMKAAETISRKKGVPLPSSYRTDFAACKAFLDAHGTPRTEG
ncbi:DNA topoisomerase-3 [Sphingobium wenxiniae]|uniref:DNA topoisomerase n=1 Tax=Sphingobium wenxiniae (strain DSM 21828 / CGMCC 1.7748 / JZ-1) TaxID=595605 RepID=A0A562K4Y3_SPHWJ|nr:DNA topoisomerase [Sphingobium wenxiniae]MBB6193092.1 DNA topoisomerase-3 [Sphingobium wenxiniae]TWH90275.1 DNA topoisomerase-3 [Sphingobium wenxiniae]